MKALRSQNAVKVAIFSDALVSMIEQEILTAFSSTKAWLAQVLALVARRADKDCYPAVDAARPCRVTGRVPKARGPVHTSAKSGHGDAPPFGVRRRAKATSGEGY